MAMVELQQNRYLWVHFAGLAFVPLLLDICLAGLASAGPALPFGWQFWTIALFGIAPALAMQWLKPFYIFSLPPSALKPAALSEDQRRCLQIFKSWQIKALAILVAAFSLWLLVKIYLMLPRISPILKPSAGLFCGAIAFFTASTFMQISVSAGRALLIGPKALKRVPAVEESAIANDFLILGFRLNTLLPEPISFESEDFRLEEIESTPDELTQTDYESATADTEPALVPLETEALSEQTSEHTQLSDELDEPVEVSASTVDESTEDEDNELEIVIPEKLPLEPEDNFPATE